MIKSCAAFGCLNRAIKNDNKAFHKFPLNNRSGIIVLRNIYIQYIKNLKFSSDGRV